MMSNQRGFTLIELMVVVMIIGILASIAVSNWLSMQATAKEGAVKSNCHTVQLAAEDFSIRNEGVYSGGADVLPSGETLVDLLPGGALLQNPFTRLYSEPQLGAAAAQAGQTGYVGIVQNGVVAGYTIDGMGRDAGLGPVIVLTSGQ